ncbi:MAG: yyaF, GTP-dependent nucleic acid-binding protein EngD [Candidatus Gottesmanbacteria bacterium GW2011_GWC1_43_10]|nr:MAG: GTP-binding protein YchF [Candidatus Gottesmanbacteria bacterium GW2011_GWA1_42_26]KKS82121.1 MAG: yyaF, GTP-dependent nucleic acid-binding protein EngD [Candidatus Gottesmanbacteria bacterium GW2011_GWC1_43_10]OGG10582.1 MAG: redox-regulated ATPase YchF [Candidatus Gottesmanbacteria bacterium RIFCSPHIGHO2_01_FULL_43_15]HCM37831.1 redox-regulated ATPase YchF [Patescibacteria group bacterium]
MNLSVGIIGLPNAGKSTLFNALLKKQVAFAANFPFATIEPNVGVVPVPDKRLPVIAKLVNTEKIVPAIVKFVDIAGLVKGAAQGEGLGNKFLSHIREVDLICNVVRTFQDADVVHVAGNVDPKRDQEIVEAELILADLQTLEKQPEPRGVVEKEVQKRWEVIQKLKTSLNQAQPARDVIADLHEKELVKDLHLLTMKPVLFVLNVGEKELTSNSVIPASAKGRSAFGGKAGIQIPGQAGNDKNGRGNDGNSNDVVVISAKIESELAGLSDIEQKEYLQSLGLEKSGLERLIQKAYQKLNLISFLTGGELEARAWTIEKGTKAPQAAGVIHTDFEKGFIKAEVISYDDFVSVGGWTKAREVGKVRLEGKEYVMQDGDVVDFKVNA